MFLIVQNVLQYLVYLDMKMYSKFTQQMLVNNLVNYVAFIKSSSNLP